MPPFSSSETQAKTQVKTQARKSAKTQNKNKHTDMSPYQPNQKSNNVATTDRQWQILALLERGRWLGTMHLSQQLQLAGFDVSLRTIQRDLNHLSERFPIEKNHANPQGWRWRSDAPMQSFPHINLSQAVALSMVEANLSQLLPPAILGELSPWFALASQHLKDSNTATSWLDKVRITPATQPLIAPQIDLNCKDNIYHALLYEQQITALYTSRQHSKPSEYQLNPLAIIQRGVILYLLATRTEDPAHIVRTFALHRFSEVSVLDDPVIIPDGFDLNVHLDAGAMGFSHHLFKDLPNQGKDTAIVLTLHPDAAKNLLESKLSNDQQWCEQDDGYIQIHATVNLTAQLVWWLRGFGKQLQAVEPDILLKALHDDTSLPVAPPTNDASKSAECKNEPKP